MILQHISPHIKGIANVIIETPKGSQNKYAYDEITGIFKLKKTLPLGLIFPFDFGFIPNTKAEDGDPLDILVIMDGPAYQGCLVECRILGMLKATQKEDKNKAVRNDRIVAVPVESMMYANITRITQLNKSIVQQIEGFFTYYNEFAGKKFNVIDWAPAKEAIDLIESCTKFEAR